MKQLWRDVFRAIQRKPVLLLPVLLVAILGFGTSLGIHYVDARWAHPHLSQHHSASAAAAVMVHGLLMLILLCGFFCIYLASHILAHIYTARLTKNHFPATGAVPGWLGFGKLDGEIFGLLGIYVLVVILSVFVGICVLLVLFLVLHGLGIQTKGWGMHYLGLPVIMGVMVLNMARFATPRLLHLIARSIFGQIDEARIAVGRRVTLIAGFVEVFVLTVQMAIIHHTYSFGGRESVALAFAFLSCFISGATAVAFALIVSVSVPSSQVQPPLAGNGLKGA